jgi:hypothetical protein
VIDKLPAEVVLQGREHPFVVALVKELRVKRESALLEVEGIATSNAVDGAVRAVLGRCRAIHEVIRMIEQAKGKAE